MVSHDRREFDKYLKFLTYKVTQVIVQSRKGRLIKTKSAPHGNEWFNVTVLDDKQVMSELKHSLEGRLPQQDSPVCVEISMEMEGESLVLEVWSVSLNYSVRDISVSVSHLLYPRLSLMLKSLIALSRTTPAYRLSRQQDDSVKFNFRIYAGPSKHANSEGFVHVNFAKTSCPYGTVSLSLSYLQTIAFPDRTSIQQEVGVNAELETSLPSESLSQKKFPFTFANYGEASLKLKDYSPPLQPFAAILPQHPVENPDLVSLTSTTRQDSGNVLHPFLISLHLVQSLHTFNPC